jgi:MFS family permease
MGKSMFRLTIQDANKIQPCQVNAVLFTVWSIGSALAPNLVSYFIFRMLTAFQGTSFLMMGSAVIGDIYKPVERATALSYFLCGTLIAPALGPFIGGVIVTYRSWRVIFWLQSVLASAATILVVLGLPETIHRKRLDDLSGLQNRAAKIKQVWQWTNPCRVFSLFRLPNLIIMVCYNSIKIRIKTNVAL